MPLLPGSHLGRFEVVSVLGAGGMGEVFRARDSRLQRDVAIKVVSATFSHDPERTGRADSAATANLVLVQNWFEELKRLAPK